MAKTLLSQAIRYIEDCLQCPAARSQIRFTELLTVEKADTYRQLVLLQV